MEEMLRKRLQLRHQKLLECLQAADEMVQKGGATEGEVTKLKLTTKNNIDAFQKEMFYLFEKFPSVSLPEATTYTEDQLKAEDMLASLETYIELSRSNPGHAPAQTTKLPKLDLPKYKGDVLKWTEFWDRFEANIDRRSLSDAEKMSYLVSYLEGPALETVQGLDTTNLNYKVAIDLLQKRFGSKSTVVDAHFDALNKIEKASNNAQDCRRTLNTIERHLRVLNTLGENTDGNHLRVLISGKFPENVNYQVRLLVSEDSNVSDIRVALDKVVSAMERADVSVQKTEVPSTSTQALYSSNNNKQERKRKRECETSVQDSRKAKKSKPFCVFCKGSHYSERCRAYKTIEDRKKRLGRKCFMCLKEGHRSVDCRGRTCFYCHHRHNCALCPKKFEDKIPVKHHKENDSKTPKKGDDATTLDYDKQINCLPTNTQYCLQTATATVQANQRTTRCRLLLDSGSQRSYITTRLAKNLSIVPDGEDELTIFTFGSSTPKQTVSPSAEIHILTKRGSEKVMKVNIVPHITDRVPVIDSPFLNNVDVAADDDTLGQRIDLLIGNDYYFSFMKGEHIKLQENLFLVNTEFGWLLTGNQREEIENSISLSVITYCQCHGPGCTYFTEPDLPLRNIDMKFLWALESIGITDSPKITKEEEVVKLFNETVVYEDGRYQVRWPWIDYPPELPTNFGLAYGRLKSLLRRSDTSVMTEYEEILKQQLEAGVIEVVDKEATSDGPIHYLPHHMVKQKGKKGRIVYDASAKVKESKSLNECLYSGPSMLEDMTSLLLNFRTGKIGIIADVEKAFLQIGLQKTDRDVTRFLWVKDPSKEPTEDNLLHLRFCRVPFGIISSPFLLTATIRYHLSRNQEPLMKEIANKCYVDNLVTTAKSTEEAVQLYHKTHNTFKELGMNIRDWTSNCKEFLQKIPSEAKDKQQDLQKVLGMEWNLENDTMRLKISDIIFERKESETKRDILRTVARLYDPCGLAAPLILPAKLLFQDLCMKKLKWDSPLPNNLKDSWNKIIEDLKFTKNIEIPRYVGDINSDEDCHYELHCFTDASKNAYAAVVYLRVSSKNSIRVSFLMAKSRVTPVEDKEDLKIPRLELLGFLIGSRLMKYVKDCLDLHIERMFLWTDSLIVLNWMQTNKLLPPFVSRRVNEIKQHKEMQFCHVNTNINPADLATRPELWHQKCNLWFQGPDFLSEDSKLWPNTRHLPKMSTSLSVGEGLDFIDGPEMTSRGYEVFLEELAENIEPSPPIEETCTKNEALDEIKRIQAEYFPDEIAGKETHLTRNLNLFLDIDGVLRSKGRVTYTDWTYEMKHPILIPKECEFTTRVIQKIHEENYHVGASHTLSILRKKYWIPQGRAIVQKILKKCPQCVKHGGGPYKLPPTPALPTERVNFSAPFTYTGLDYFGPLFIDTEHGKEKRWVCLYTCLAVRAIHLEVVKNLTAEECLLALRRFCSTRGTPTLIVSDNALQFKLTAEVLSDKYCNEKGLKWKFIPQLAPWHGGFYERMVALVKHCLKRTLDKHLLNESQLTTVMKEVEAVVNTRPLTRVGTELEHVLRPSDFLNLGKCVEITPSDQEISSGSAIKVDLLKSWKRGQRIINEFKTMFQDQYLLNLRERYKHSTKQPRVKSDRVPQLGDIVQIKEENKNRQNWKVGTIKELIQGHDGEVRIAKVQVGNTEFTRSIGHLYPLEDQAVEINSVQKSNPIEISETETAERTEPSSVEHMEVCERLATEEAVAIEDVPLPDRDQDQDLAFPADEPMEEVASQEENTPDVEAYAPSNELEHETGRKRDAAIRAREKIAEWTRLLMVLFN